MTNQNPLKDQKEGALLTPQERVVCQNITAGKSLDSQRAKALLALDEGATQAQAAQLTGLTRNQVKYWLGKFRRERLDAFPEAALLEAQAEPKASKIEEGPDEVVPAVESSQEEQPAKKSKQDKKAKGSKKKKKSKGRKKGSKKKKGKKKKKSKKKSKS
jgi:transposase-like protein